MDFEPLQGPDTLFLRIYDIYTICARYKFLSDLICAARIKLNYNIQTTRPLYKHTEPTSWSHGYAVQFVSPKSGRFLHVNVPIHKGESMLMNVTRAA